MLNYISAEWYKLRHTKGIFVAFGFLLVLITFLFFPSFALDYQESIFPVYAMAYLISLLLGFFLAPIFAARAFDDQYGRGTLKNEIVFGIPRSRIYFGKLAFGALTGTAAALIVLGFYLLLCALANRVWEKEILVYIELCLRGTLLVLPLWLACMSFAFCLQTVFKSSAGAIALNYILLIFTMPLALIAPSQHTDSLLWNFFSYWHFVSPFRALYNSAGGEWLVLPELGWSLAVGVGWITVTSAIGLAAFNKREIS